MKPQPTHPTTISTFCLRAADVLRERGWHQGGLRNIETGAVCMMGALLVAAGWDGENTCHDGNLFAIADNAVERHLRRIWPQTSIPNFNDDIAKEANEVIAVLEAVAWEHAREGALAA